MKSFKAKLLIVLAVVVVAGLAYATGAGMLFMPQKATAAGAVYSQDTVTSIYDSASPAVVEIDTVQQNAGFFGGSSQGQGSGFLVDTSGNILTNNHVVEGATTEVGS